MKLKLFFLFTLSFCMLCAQNLVEQEAPDYIRSILFFGNNEDQFPIVQIGESINLAFDDLSAEEADYYYKISHRDYNWKPSNIPKTQFLNGNDNQRIINYKNSFNTIQSYSHYKLSIPNQDCSLKISGNYLLEIYDEYDELLFTRGFVVYTPQTSVGVSLKRSRNLAHIDKKQVVQFQINTLDLQIPNPKKDIHVVILQNYQWYNAIRNIRPQYTIGNTLIYKYDKETSFWGGNENLYFDSKDIRATANAIQKVYLDQEFHHLLFVNKTRADQPYTYFPDINGSFVIRTLQGKNQHLEGEYSNIHFGLELHDKYNLKEIYVVGKFCNYKLQEENKLTYNREEGFLETIIPLKQGFYNYRFVIKNLDGSRSNLIGGDFFQTENQYTVLVYFRKFGDLHDSIVGVGQANASNIRTN
ncbi:MAG: DUF5103 domain-containing protein [Flavobacteriaceae bacterium]|nr:DUF5103 domain-containing protein [Flavobacteriaceae bacterium]